MADAQSVEEQRSSLSNAGELTRSVLYNNPTDAANTLQASGFSFVPTGMVYPFASNVLPNGFILCDGAAYERTKYPQLFVVLSTTFNTGGETATQFRVPDLRGRTIFGRDNMGGTAQNRVTTAGSAINGASVGASGGNQFLQQHNHGVTDPGHGHTVYDPGHAHNYYYARSFAGYGLSSPNYGNAIYTNDYGKAMSYEGTGITFAGATTGITIQTNGSGTSENMPPTLILNYIIKT